MVAVAVAAAGERRVGKHRRTSLLSAYKLAYKLSGITARVAGCRTLSRAPALRAARIVLHNPAVALSLFLPNDSWIPICRRRVCFHLCLSLSLALSNHTSKNTRAPTPSSRSFLSLFALIFFGHKVSLYAPVDEADYACKMRARLRKVVLMN